MTIPTLRQIAGGIDARLATIPGLNHYPAPPAAPNFPCAFPVPPPINYRNTMRAGVITLRFDVVVMESIASWEDGQLRLLDLLDWAGDSSIFLALSADKTLGLGSQVDAAVVDETRPLGLEDVAGYEAFGHAMPLLVAITNTPNP